MAARAPQVSRATGGLVRNRAMTILDDMAARRDITEPVMVVVAHPDDETIGMGGQLCRFRNALLVHVTDGAPRDGRDAQAYGFASVADYAAARRRELEAALQAGEATALGRLKLGIADQGAARELPSLARRIAALLERARPAAVFTHAYEGGHPDHDAAAFAVHAACRLVETPAAIIEFPLYHRAGGVFTTGDFLCLCSLSPERQQQTAIRFEAEEGARKRRMIDCFVTQRGVLEQFDIAVERFRPAPDYHFQHPPHPGALNYECWGMPVTGAEWRQLAGAAMRQLGLRPR